MSSVQHRYGGYQLRVKHKLLAKPFFHTFDSESEARDYGAKMDALLQRGIVPQELLSLPKAKDDLLIIEVVRGYTQRGAITDSDDELLTLVIKDNPVSGLRVSGVTFSFAESYVAWLKSAEKNLAPSSIRKRVDALARVVDWHIRQTTRVDVQPIANPLRLLQRGYSVYTRADAQLAPVKRDVVRDRRLTPLEDQRIRDALAGVKRDDRQRALVHDPAFSLLYALIVDTGMRLMEAYRLRVSMIDFKRHFINVEGSKGHRGVIKPRVLPIKKELRQPLADWCAGRVGLLFPFWDGDPATQKQATGKLSYRFRQLFDYALVEGCTEHDLRHEAACRWFTLRNERGWVFSETEICKLMGWTDSRMALRYASLRGEDLSSRLG